MFALWAVLMNSLGWRCTSEITPINSQLQYQTTHCSLALKRSVSFRNEELSCKEEDWHLENGETVHLPCKTLPFTKSQDSGPGGKWRLLASWSGQVTFPWVVDKTAEKAWRAEKLRLQLPLPPAQELILAWAGIQMWLEHRAGMDFLSATRMVSPHSYHPFLGLSIWRFLFIWKNKSALILSPVKPLGRRSTQPGKRLTKKPPSVRDRGTQFLLWKLRQTFS